MEGGKMGNGRSGWEGGVIGSHLGRDPSYIIKRSKCSIGTVTLTQQSGRYSVDNCTEINCWNCSISKV